MSLLWKDMRVLITGAAGFIGSHLVETLYDEGARVRAFVRYNSRGDLGLLRQLPSTVLNEIEIIPGDLRDAQAIRLAIEGVDIVFHLGAMISIPYSYQHPREVAETNFMGTLNVLMACHEYGINRLIHTSTSEVYGTALTVPIDESHPLQGQSPYSASKIGADKLAESYYCTYELPVVTVRPFNTYGPRQSARAVIPTIITQALAKNTVYLGALDTLRDFTYVSDTVNGILKAAETPGIDGQTFNLGSGEEVRIGDLAKRIIQIVERPVKIVVDPTRLRPRRSEVMRLLSDYSQASKCLDWQPMVPLERGLQRTIEWIEAHLSQYRTDVYAF